MPPPPLIIPIHQSGKITALSECQTFWTGFEKFQYAVVVAEARRTCMAYKSPVCRPIQGHRIVRKPFESILAAFRTSKHGKRPQHQGRVGRRTKHVVICTHGARVD
jgi:hypothetical protein